jgi:hypothetical protein
MDTIELNYMVEVIEALLGEARQHMNGDDRVREGGWFCLLDVRQPPGWMVRVHERIGQLQTDKEAKYREFSLEKATRLASHPEHTTSRESRDEAAAQYGGAIHAHGYILSFSGLPEVWDEAIMLQAAILCDLLTPDEARRISNAEISRLLQKLDGVAV